MTNRDNRPQKEDFENIKTVPILTDFNADSLELDNNMITNSMQKIINSLNRKKDEILKQKLTEHNLIHLLDNITAKRFRPLVVEIEKETQKETYYADNGTNEGLRIVTFEFIYPKLDILTDAVEVNMGIKLSYY